MPKSITPIARRTAQLKALMQVRNTLPRPDFITVVELYDLATVGGGLDASRLDEKQLELIDTLARTYLSEVAR